MTIGLGALSVSFRGSYAAGPTFDYIVTNDGDASTEGSLAWAIALGSATLSGKRVGIAPGLYTTPVFSGLTPDGMVTFQALGSGVRIERPAAANYNNLRFRGFRFTTNVWAISTSPAFAIGGTMGNLDVRDNVFGGNWRGDVDFPFDPTNLSDTFENGFHTDNRYHEFAQIWPVVDEAGTITDLFPSRKNTDLADGTYDVIFDGTAGHASEPYGSGAEATFTVEDGVIVSVNLINGGSGYIRSGVGRITSWAGQTRAGDYFQAGLQVTTALSGVEEIVGTILVEDNTFRLLSDSVKLGGFLTGTARLQIRRNTWDMIYKDTPSFGVGLVPPVNIDVSGNFRTRPVFSFGDPGDPHADGLIQVFMDDNPSGGVTEGLVRLDCYANVSVIGNARGEYQGGILSDCPNDDPETAFTAGELGIGISGNLGLMRSNGNGLSCTGSRWLPVYGNTFVAWDTAEIGNATTISMHSNVYPGTIVGGNISEATNGSGDPDSDFSTYPNATAIRTGGGANYASIFASPDSHPQTYAAALTAYATIGAFADKGAARLINPTTRTLNLDLLPTATWFPAVTGADTSTETTSSASRILLGPEGVDVVPDAGTEWRVADNEAMDDNPTSWSADPGSGPYRGKFIQWRGDSAATGSSSVQRGGTLNGTASRFTITTASVVVFSAVNNGGSAWSSMSAPASETGLTQFIFVMRYRGPSSPTANTRIVAASTASQFQYWNPSSTTQRFGVGASSVWVFRADVAPDDQWHTHYIRGDLALGDTNLGAQQWFIDGTAVGKADSSGFTPSSTFTTSNLFAGGSLGIFAQGGGSNIVNGGDIAFVWMHWATGGLTLPDFSDPSVRDDWSADAMNLTTGAAGGFTPKLFAYGNAAAFNAGLGNKGTIGGTFTKGAGTYTDAV